MTLRRVLGFVVGLTAIAAGISLRAQTRAVGPLAPFGVSEAAVQSMLLRVLDGGGVLLPGSQIVGTIQSGYARVPAAMRARATTAAFACAKRYLHSPAFAAAYAKFREQHRPPGAVSEAGSIDEIVQRQLEEYVAKLEAGKKNLDALSPPRPRKGNQVHRRRDRERTQAGKRERDAARARARARARRERNKEPAGRWRFRREVARRSQGLRQNAARILHADDGQHRLHARDPTVASWPIPLVIKNLNNPL